MQQTRKPFGVILAGVLALSLALAGCGASTDSQSASQPAAPSTTPSTSTPAPAQAKPSGTITLYTSESQDQVNEMVADFQKVNPDVKVNVFRSGTGEVIAKLQTEMQADAVQADVIWFADYAFFNGIQDKLVAYDSPQAKDLKPGFKYDGGKFYEVRQIFNVVAYNTKKVTKAPTSWKDLADPAYKGKIGMPSPLYSGGAFTWLGTLTNTPDFGWDYVKSLKANGIKVEKGNGGVTTKLGTGEYAMATVVDFMVRNLKATGSPVDYVWPKEGAILVPTPVGILSSSKNQDAAKAFIDHLLSTDGQKLFLKQGYMPVKDGIGLPAGTPDLAALKLAKTDYDYIQKNRDAITKNYKDIFPQ